LGRADSGQRERVDVVDEFFGGGRVGGKLRVEAVDDRAVLEEEEALGDDAAAEEEGARLRDSAAGEVGDDAGEFAAIGANPLLHQLVEGAGRLEHLAAHDGVMPFGAIRVEEAADHAVDEMAEAVFGGIGGALPFAGGFHGGAFRGVEALGVELGFVAEVIVDGGDIDASAIGDLADGGFVKAVLGENGTGGGDELLACLKNSWGIGNQHRFQMIV
jgi:hypothetical protein